MTSTTAAAARTSDWTAATCAVCANTGGTIAITVGDAATGQRSSVIECDECGLRRLDPRPSDAALSIFYADDYYSYVGRRRSPLKQYVWDRLRDEHSGVRPAPVGLRRLARAAARWQFDTNIDLSDQRRPRVIDVGCGYGDLLMFLQSRGCSVLGIELDGRAAVAGRELGIPIEPRPLAELALEPGSVDIVIMQHSLEHIADPSETVAEIARVVRPGGQLHISVPSGAAAGLRLERDRWGALSYPLHFWFFTPESLSRLLLEHGFDVTESRSRTIIMDHVRLFRRAIHDRDGSVARDVIRAVARTWLPLQGDILRTVAVRRA